MPPGGQGWTQGAQGPRSRGRIPGLGGGGAASLPSSPRKGNSGRGSHHRGALHLRAAAEQL